MTFSKLLQTLQKTANWPMTAFCGYSLVYYLFLYHPGLVRYDDFGYLQGVIETWVRGRPMTHDWLAPYSATTSSLSAGAYWLTGKFIWSTWGLQSLFVMANFLLLYKILRHKLSPNNSALFGFALCTMPIYWYKSAEFGGNIFTFTFVLFALLAYQKNRWPWFFLATFLAFANRQNSIALLALPFFHLFTEKEKKPKLILLSYFSLFTSASFLFHTQMNISYAQSHSIYKELDFNLIAGVFQTLTFGLFAALALLSGFQWLSHSHAIINLKYNLRHPLLSGMATLLFLWFPLFQKDRMVDFQTPFLGSLDQGHFLQYLLWLFIPACLWILDWKLIQWKPSLALCLTFILLTSMRGFWFDNYLVDIGLVVLIYSLSMNRPSPLGNLPKTCLLILIFLQLLWTYAYKIQLEKNWLGNHIYETLERENKLNVDQMTDIAFGFAGWKLFDYQKQQEKFTSFDAFRQHIRKDQVVLETELPWRRSFKHSLKANQKVLKQGFAQIGFFSLRFRAADLASLQVESISQAGYIPLDLNRFKKKYFPLNEAEWNQYIYSLP